LGAILRGTATVKDAMDVANLCILAEDPNVLVVRPDSKYKTLKDLIDDARQNPDKVRGSVGSIGGTEHIIMNRMERATGVKFSVTAFAGTSYVPVLGGHTDFTVSTPVDVLQSVKAGKLKILAAVGDTRMQLAPEVPTMKEQGVNTSFRQYRGLWGAPSMPDYAVKFWGQACSKLFETKAFKDFLKKVEMDPVFMGPDQLSKFMPDYARELAVDIKDLEVFGGKK
jgi:putative tricarboxylic transport membrane protein